MLKIVIEISSEVDDPQGVKERLAADLEKFGDVRVVSVTGTQPEQLRMEASHEP